MVANKSKSLISVVMILVACVVGLALTRSNRELPPLPSLESIEPSVASALRDYYERAGDGTDASWSAYAECLLAHGLKAEALTVFTLLAEDAEDPFEPLYLSGRILAGQDVDRAIAALEAAHELRPRFAPLLVVLGECHLDGGDDEKAMDCFTRAIEISDSTHARVGLARALSRRGEAQNAVIEAEKARDLDRSNGDALRLLAVLYQKAGRRDDALRAEMAARDQPDSKAVGCPIMSRIAARAASFSAYEQQAIEQMRAGRFRDAERFVDKALETRPEAATALEVKAEILMRTKQFVEARDIALRLPANASRLCLAARCEIALGRQSEATRLVQAAIELDRNHPDVHLLQGNFHLSNLRFAEAEAAGRRAVALAPMRTDAVVLVGLALHAQGRVEEGIAELRRAHEMTPDDEAIENILRQIERR